MAPQNRQFPHIYLPENGQSAEYTRPPQGGGSSSLPRRDRVAHSQVLEQAITTALQVADQQLRSRNPDIADDQPGFYLEFKLKADKSSVVDSLENRQQKIELVAAKSVPGQDGVISATVFVPESSAQHYLKKIEQYRDEETPKGTPKNEPLIARVESIQIGRVESLFTDDLRLFPSEQQEVWWEVWLRKDRYSSFSHIVETLNIQISDNTITFPEHRIILALADVNTMAQVIDNSGAIAELRIAKDTPSAFLDMGPIEQSDWSEDLAERLTAPDADAPSICILDSGVTRSHRLLSPALHPNDMHTVDPSWLVGDSHHGHGTAMAGIALYRDLYDTLVNQSGRVQLSHRLESVKILPNVGGNDPALYGAITEQGISLPEIQEPNRRRVFCMAITSSENATDRGTPSAWSAAVDQICFNDGDFRRLLIIAAGNITQDIFHTDYLNINDVESVEDPAQAWNPLVVGAYTEKLNIIDPAYSGWKSLAPGGDLSPRSRTSVEWQKQWPIRPDVVFEGGNMAHDSTNPALSINDLSLLSTHHAPRMRMFTHMCDTSCATALASYMAARIMSVHPNYRAETTKALIVHSAEWTSAMKAHFGGASSKTAKRALVRRYGYGVPSLERALRSANNDLTLVIEDDLQPFQLKVNKVATKDMNIHKLPWPSEALEALGETSVELKVTLSYFVEPNPGERGWAYRHRYASHGLRFKIKDSLESDEEFKWRVSAFAREEREGRNATDRNESNWVLGPTTRDCGSLHCDIWTGFAAELAQKDAVVVFPIGGWWKEKKYLERYENRTPYSLVLSIRVPEVEVDIYTPVANAVSISVAV